MTIFIINNIAIMIIIKIIITVIILIISSNIILMANIIPYHIICISSVWTNKNKHY